MIEIKRDPLTSPDIQALLVEHLADMYATSPPESVHVLDIERLKAPDIVFWSAWQDGQVRGCIALKRHHAMMAEIKSMRTAKAARGKGVAKALLAHLEQFAKTDGVRMLYLETGAESYFTAARQLYLSHGYQVCGPFADYQPDPLSVFMQKML